MRLQMGTKGRARVRAGFTLIEMILGVAVLAILARMVIGASSSIGSMTETGNIEARMQRESDRAMRQIMRDLRGSGYQVLNGRQYPYVFDGGVATGDFAAYSYQPAPQTAQPGDPDFGPLRSLVLCLPSDLDGDGRPELDADGNGTPELDGNGDGVPTDEAADVNGLWDPNVASITEEQKRLVWSHDDVAYVVTTGPTGENELVRLVANGAGGRRVVARDVERVQFDTTASAPGDVPVGAVRVQLFFRTIDSDGHVMRSRTDAVVRLRNSDPTVSAGGPIPQ